MPCSERDQQARTCSCMITEKKQRIRRVAILAALFLICGLVYAGIVTILHHGIPCWFHVITGLKCPGCGITRSMLSLLRFNFKDVLRYNLFAPLIVFYLGWIFVYNSCIYIRRGRYNLSSGSQIFDITFLVLFLGWGIVRNIIGI